MIDNDLFLISETGCHIYYDYWKQHKNTEYLYTQHKDIYAIGQLRNALNIQKDYLEMLFYLVPNYMGDKNE
jgi:hypothetical protein